LAVNAVLQKALTKNPHERYPTVQAFANDLLAASQDATQQLVNVPRPGPSDTRRVQPELRNVQTEVNEWQAIQPVGVTLANAHATDPIALPATPAPAVNPAWEPMIKNELLFQDVHTEAPKVSRYSNRWIWRSLFLNLLICLVFAAEYSWQTKTISFGVLIALCPALLVGPLLARSFRRISLTTFSWGLFWGVFFGMTNALLSTLLCLAWNTLLFIVPFWGGIVSGLSDFFSKVLAFDPQVVVLMLLALWMSVIGGALIGIFSVRDEDVEPLTHRGSRK